MPINEKERADDAKLIQRESGLLELVEAIEYALKILKPFLIKTDSDWERRLEAAIDNVRKP